MSPAQKVLDVLSVAGLRIISNGDMSAGVKSALVSTGNRYKDAELAKLMRMLANVLDKEEQIDG